MRVECLPIKCLWHLFSDTYSNANECHFFITITNMVRSNKMMVNRSRNFIIKVFVLITINLLSFYRLEVDTQQLIFPTFDYTISPYFKQANKINKLNIFLSYTIGYKRTFNLILNVFFFLILLI